MPIETMMTCVAGTKNMLEIANMNKAVLVQASTSEVYGDPETSPQFESDKGSVNSYGPRSCYDEGKRAAEALCYDYLHKFNVDARLVRIFNTYGPHMLHDDGRVITNFINQALHGKMITIYGAGKQTRSFCYVDDLIAAIIAMGELKKNPMTPINIGNPNEFTIRELADKVTNMIESSQGFEFKSLPVDDPMQRKPDITKAMSILNWQPKVEIDEGLARTIQYFKSE
jgi:UDP-glucuronate decarboxylase